MAPASDTNTPAASPAFHSPRGVSTQSEGTAPAAAGGGRSPPYLQEGIGSVDGGGMFPPWADVVGRPHVESAFSSSASAPSTVGISAVPPLLLSPSLSSAAEEQMVNSFSSDRSPSKAVAAAGASASFLLEDLSGKAQPESSEKSENTSGGGSNESKKPAWNKPSNGASEVGPVMGAVSWPALSESTRASPKSSSSDFSKNLSDGSLPVSQGTGIGSPSANRQGSSSNVNSNSTPNHATYNRQRSMKRGGGHSSNNASANGGLSQLPSPRGSAAETAHGNPGKHVNSAADSLSRDNTHRDGGQRSQLHSGHEHQQQRNSFRRSSGGQHPRGDGPHHHGYGGRRSDQDRGNQDWHSNRSFGVRDNTQQQQQQRVVGRTFRSPAPNPPPPFIPPAPIPIHPIGSPIVYPELHSVFYLSGPPPEAFRPVAMVPPIPQMFFSLPDPQLPTKIVNQIDYYFSNENLIKDTFLRQNMDDQGWVPIKLIASFKKVMELTDNIQLILESVKTSSHVEVEGEKVRKRNDWTRWLMPPFVQHSTLSSPQSVQKSSQDMLGASLQRLALDDKTAAKHGYSETYLSPSSSGEWSSHSQQSSGEKSGQVAVQVGFQSSVPNSSK